ncbi:MAG: ribonuclease Z [Arcticibacterium sp.]
MKLTVLGVGSASPQVDKNPSAFLLSIDNEYILIDCGEGTQYRLLENSIKVSRIKTICISHLHGDHYFGLIGLLSSFNLKGRRESITLIGPKGLLEILDIQFAAANTTLNYELNFVLNRNTEGEVLLDRSRFKIESIPLVHRVQSTGFLVTEKEGDRHIQAHKLPENFPIPFYNKLKDGKDVIDPLTKVAYKAADLTKRGTPKKVFAYCSDTAYYPEIVPIAKGANLMYHEATFLNDLEERAEMTQHSTALQAARIAKASEVKKLLLGHLSSRYKSSDEHILEAKESFENVEMAIEGAVYDII